MATTCDNQKSSVATIETLLELLRRQQSIVQRLDALGGDQTSHIENDRSDALLGLLQQRQNLIDQFATAQREFQQCQAHLADALGRAAESTRQNIRSLVQEISTGIESVLQRDERDQSALQQRRSQVKSELNRLDTAQSARSAYRNPKAVHNRFADTQG